jgi:hypothetical protein
MDSNAADQPTTEVKVDVKKPEVQPTFEVDTEKVEFTSGIKFKFRGTILEFRKGEIKKISKELRDLLLKRECIILRA